MGCCASHGLAGLFGLSDNLMGALIASGSRVRAGFEYQTTASIGEHNAGEDSAATIQEVLTGVMLGSGIFRDAFVQVKEPGWGGLQNGYITATGTTYVDVGDSYEISNLIAGLIQAYLPVLRVTRRDAVGIDYVPPTAVGKQNVQQVYDPGRPNTQTQNQNQLGQPSECKWDDLDFGDWIACNLGIKSPIGGVGVGAVGALLAVGLGTLVLVAVLKR
jgi:hypothetical protein